MTDTPDYAALLKAVIYRSGIPVHDGNSTSRMFLPAATLAASADHVLLLTESVDRPGIGLKVTHSKAVQAEIEREELVEKFTTYIHKNVMVSEDYARNIAKALVKLGEKNDT